MKHIFYTICFLYLFSSCTEIKTIDSVPEHDIKITKNITNIFLGRPTEISYLDGFLLVSDNMDETLLDIYDLKGDSILSRIFKRGHGPDELLSPITLDVSEKKNEVYVFQRQNSQMNTYSFSNLLHGDYQPKKRAVLQDADRAININNGYLASGLFKDASFHLFDLNGEKMIPADIYPYYIQKIDDISERYKLGQGYFAYNYNSNILAFASYFTGDISFYSIKGNKLSEIKHFSFGDGRIKKKIEASSKIVNIEENDIVYSYGICSTNHYFYVLFSGKTMKEEKKSKAGNYILKFDLEGNVICKYKHDFPIIDICFSKDNDFYAISQSENLEYNIIAFSLN